MIVLNFLLIVIAKHNVNRNCLPFKVKGQIFSIEDVIILGMRCSSLILMSVITLISIVHLLKHVIINCVPLHKHIDWFKFHSSITEIPIFNCSSQFGDPLNFKVFKYSVGYNIFWSKMSPSILDIESEL